jgi:hypothetical protein
VIYKKIQTKNEKIRLFPMHGILFIGVTYNTEGRENKYSKGYEDQSEDPERH